MKPTWIALLLGVFLIGDAGGARALAAATPDSTAKTWSTSFYPPGTDYLVLTGCVHLGRTVIGGNFWRVGDREIRSLAWQTPQGWQSLPGTLDGIVTGLASNRGDLFAGGQLEVGSEGVPCPVALLRDDRWEPLFPGSGLTATKFVVDGDGVMIARGLPYVVLTETPQAQLHWWTGARLDTLAPPPLNGMSDFEKQGDRMAAAGWDRTGKSMVTEWDGSTWLPRDLPDSTLEVCRSGEVRLAYFQGDLYALLDQYGGFRPTGVLFRWTDRGWVDTGDRFSIYTGRHSAATLDLAVFDGQLVVAGAFRQVNGIPSRGLVGWNGSEWTDLSGCLDSTCDPWIYWLQVAGGRLFVMGSFSQIGDVQAEGVALWDGERWTPVVESGGAVAGTVHAFTDYQGDVIAGGSFDFAGGVAATNVARWTGDRWVPLGGGLPTGDVNHLQYVPGVSALTTYEGDLIATGQIGSDDFPSDAARWNGATWEPMGHLRGMLRSLAVFGGELYVGGEFCLSDHDCLIAKWNGEEWVSVDGGLDSTVTYAGVRALLPVEDDTTVPYLAVGGWFRARWARSILAWTGVWHHLGSGFSGGTVSALARYKDWIVAAGSLNGSIAPDGSVAPADGVVRWIGDRWVELDGTVDGWPYALGEYDGSLYVGGDIAAVASGGLSVSNIARWNAGWDSLGAGVDGEVYALHVADGKLFVGGDFRVAGGLPSPGVAVWAPPEDISLHEIADDQRAPALTVIPFSGSVRITFDLARPQELEVNVYDVAGRLVERVASGQLLEGAHVLSWDGRTRGGRKAPAGIYFIRLRSADGVREGRAVLLH